jgi:mono/diheme cytochrome c family protein
LTEIPEHLLKRAAARRAAMGGESGDAAADAPASADAPVPAAGGDAPAATPAKAAPAPLPTLEEPAAKEKPDSPVVAAAKRRKRVPYWAAPVLALLPLWGIIYVSSVSEPPAGDTDPLVLGAEVYTAQGCSGCHGVNGEGGTGIKLSEGEVNKTFADPLSMVHWIQYGAIEGARDDGTYGDLDREGGPHSVDTLPGQMPAFPDLDAKEMAELTIYIREGIAGGDPADDPNFNVETFEADPDALAAMVEAVKELGPGGDPDIASVEGAETE